MPQRPLTILLAQRRLESRDLEADGSLVDVPAVLGEAQRSLMSPWASAEAGSMEAS